MRLNSPCYYWWISVNSRNLEFCRTVPWLKLFFQSAMTDSWFTADFHLGHRNIIRYCARPFRDVGEMDSTILDRLNAAAKERETLYFLGDFCLGGAKHVERYLDGVRCKRIYFIKGNHDRTMRKLQHRFIWFGDLA
jgi:calcineurin-like phosphoesterase family protein